MSRSTKPAPPQKTKGRPQGARTNKQPPVNAEKTRCPACGSTEREPYFATVEHEIVGVRDGRPHTHVVWRRTRCRACSQVRQDRYFENRPAQQKRRRRR